MEQREKQLRSWVEQQLQLSLTWQALPRDASFRRYFRVAHGQRTWIVMDSPPDLEDCGPFLYTAKLFSGMGLNVPEVVAHDKALGYLVLDDFGSELLLHALNHDTVDAFYTTALRELAVLQGGDGQTELPVFDKRYMLGELQNFRSWFLQRHLGLRLSETDENLLSDTFELITSAGVQQPQVWIHRDYQSRNLMVLDERHLGILDFQDAMVGPVTYDPASLLCDCYVSWPLAQVEAWLRCYFDLLQRLGVASILSFDNFLQDFHYMVLQRHLKNLFIFTRKFYRDDNDNYLQHLPRTYGYVTQSCEKVPGGKALLQWLQANVEPHWESALAECVR